MDRKDRPDEVTSADLTPVQQRQAAALALWRLRAPLLGFTFDAEWGIDVSVLESMFLAAASAPVEESARRYDQATTELRGAPLFTSEVDPEVRELVQLETVVGLLTFGEVLETHDPDKIETIRDCPRGLAGHLDRLVEDSFWSDPAEDAHRRYLATLPERVRRHGLGYLASRNLAVEFDCHEALPALPPGEGLLDTSAGRDLITHCDDVGAELVRALRWLNTTGY
ncbi:hypothetical protein ABZ883_20065 [Streptomyces sp. NPDC046977]|uniref:hypothetical protein n=1 Tax=Streptomyces sp. NPDC046977 TaxID=3154703 RepID=UPI0033D5D8F9